MSGNITPNLKTFLIGILTLKIVKSSEKTKNKSVQFTTLYQFSMENPTEAKFSVGEDKDVSLISVLDKLVSRINKDAEILFSQQSASGDFTKKEATDKEKADEQIDELATKYAAEKMVDYSEAVRAVLNDPANAELKAAYLA